MRRTVALALGVMTVLAVSTAAGATVFTSPPDLADLPAATGAQAPAERSGGLAPAAGTESTEATLRATPKGPPSRVSSGRAESGRVEHVTANLGYLNTERSTILKHPGAEYVKVHFSKLLMLPGDYLTISDQDGTEVHRIEADPIGTVLGTAGRWSMSVTGDTARVELHQQTADLLGLGSTVSNLGVSVDKVARGFTAAERASASAADRQAKKDAATDSRQESVCGRDDSLDAICYKTADPVIYRRSKAVARLLIGGTELCTAFRVGAGNRMITNQHCIGSADEAADVEVWFNYQCAECNGYDVFRPTKVWVDQLLSSDATLDYALFSVTDFEQVIKFGYLDLDVRRPEVGEQLYIPQHPAGVPTVVAINSDRDRAGNCLVQDNSYEGYAADSDISYYCDTAGGSSGSPVLSRQSDAVVALHHFGGCPNSAVRMDLIHARIAHLL